MAFQLQTASRKRAKLRMAFCGPPGAGKTFSSIKVAKHLIGEPYLLDDPSTSRIAVIDTERDRSQFYADEFHFRHGSLPPDSWHPKIFTEALRVAESECDVVILDSITHEWKWCLNQVEILKPKYRGNTWSTWSEIRPPHDSFVDSIMSSSAHVICTMRSKMSTEMVSEGGRKEVKQLGMEAIQESELDYAFDIVMDIARENNSAMCRKSIIRVNGENPLIGKVFQEPGEAFAKFLLECLSKGEVVPQKKSGNGNGSPDFTAIGEELESKLATVESPSDIAALSAEYTPRFRGAPADVRTKVKALFDGARSRVVNGAGLPVESVS